MWSLFEIAFFLSSFLSQTEESIYPQRSHLGQQKLLATKEILFAPFEVLNHFKSHFMRFRLQSTSNSVGAEDAQYPK